MPFALLIIGTVLVVAAVKNTQSDLVGLLKKDLSGPNNFIYWIVAILIIGAIGYIPKLKGLSTGFLGLVLLVLFLAKGDPSKASGGFFEKFTQGIGSATATAAATPAAVAATNTIIGPGTTANPPVTINPGIGGNTGSGYNSAFPALSNLLDWLKVPGGPVPLPGTSTVQ
jgi:hypothetical protein